MKLTIEPGDSIYFRDDHLHVIDQTRLPLETVMLELETPAEVVAAIRRLAVRGAPAIGIAGAYGVLLAAIGAGPGVAGITGAAREAVALIGASRPTARNLFWALEAMENVLDSAIEDPQTLLEQLRLTADGIAIEVIETDKALVQAGQEVISGGCRVLTHCNSGPLAALRFGTAVGVFIEAHRLRKDIHVFVDETRPLLQGARLTAWELANAGVPYTLIPDNTAAMLMKQGRVDLVMTGADRIAANGDSANKIGTYGLAVLARVHCVPFYIAAPGSTVDLSCATGQDIVIEERSADEVRTFAGCRTAPADAPVYNPAFDVTPAELITGIVTDRGTLRAPYSESLQVFA
ncbi:MAG: S-methyl-5-thioribose-1-phosphate isomerase [Candidatus Geothermincolia bacterium]